MDTTEVFIGHPTIREWNSGTFYLALYGGFVSNGRPAAGYEFWDDAFDEEQPVVVGTDYCPSPLHDLDSNKALETLICLLCHSSSGNERLVKWAGERAAYLAEAMEEGMIIAEPIVAPGS